MSYVLSEERVSQFDRKAGLACQNRIPGGNAVELAAEIVHDEEIAVRSVGVPQPEIHADRIFFDRVDLHEK